MYSNYFNFFHLFGLLILLATPVLSQDVTLEQLMRKAELNEEKLDLNFAVEKLTEAEQNRSSLNVLPSAKSVKPKSSEDYLSDTKDTGNFQKSENSRVEQYYEFLTPQILPIFGHESFSNESRNDVMFFNTIDKGYKLAPGDVLRVTIRGLTSLDKKIQVSQFGDIILPNFIPLNVEGLNLKEVEEEILNQLKLDDSSAVVNIELEAARLVPIQITGAARFPQTLAVPAYTPLSRIIPKVGGIRKDGSFRNITLTDTSKSKKTIDLYGLLRNEDEFDDPILHDATRIHVNDIGLTVAVSGFVGRPGIFELPRNAHEISVTKLLKLANANMIPAGATLEIMKFDEDGIVQKQKIINLEEQTVLAGEVLNVELPQTSNIDQISVEGAVLRAYAVNTGEERSLAEILKYGTTLKDNAILDFAIIKPPNTLKKLPRSVDIHYALKNPNKVLIKPGESVIILNQKLYNLILNHANEATKPEKSDKQQQIKNEVASKTSKYDIKSLINFLEVEKLLRSTQKVYIDDKIVLLSPDLPTNSLAHGIKEGINLPRDLNLDFALKIENFGKTNRKVMSFSPKEVFNDNDKSFLSYPQTSKSNIKLFSNKYLLSVLKSDQEEISNNFSHPQSSNSRMTILEKSTDLMLINDSKTKDMVALTKAEIMASQPVRIFIDKELQYIISKNTNFRYSEAFELLSKDQNIYPFFARTMAVKNRGNQVTPAPRYSSLLDITNGKGKLSKVELFTYNFVRQLFVDKEVNLVNILEDDQKNRASLTSMQVAQNQVGLDQLDLNQMALNQTNSNRLELNQISNPKTPTIEAKPEFDHFNAFKRNSKLISGALEKPGFYPIIGKVNIEDLISIAGGLLPRADIQNIELREYANINGETSIAGSKYLDISSIHPSQIVLDGHFTIYIPYLVNNADAGTIKIDGEVLHPGMYTFSREETLEEVLIRAGGFTKTAYPLGASFHRESLKSIQKLTNANLAREVEQSILFLSQSQLSGAGDQIKAVVAYANQLKKMPATGKQTLDIEGSSRTMLLEDGDELIIPKRPSHVTISGSVQNPVTTVYEPSKSLDDYIVDSGGFKRIADKKNVFVLLPNGKNITISSLQRGGTVIPAGSVIVVPPKTDKLTALGLTDIWSRVLGNIATSILAINAATQ